MTVRQTVMRFINDAALASSINAIAFAELDGMLSYVNQAFIDMWKLRSAKDAIGHSVLEFWSNPEEAASVVAALQQRGSWLGELQALRQDGSLADLQVSAHMVKRDGAGPLCMMASFVDVTAQKLAERQLHQTNALLNSLIESMPAMVFVKRASDLSFVKFNHAGELLTGYSEQEMLGKSDLDFFPPEQADFFVTSDRKVLASHQLKDIPRESILTRSGETRILHTRKIGIYDAAGEPAYLLGVSMDITEQKGLEDKLRKSSKQVDDALAELRYQKYAIDQHAIVATTDVRGTIIYANEKFCEISGYDQQELLGQNHRIINSGTHPKAFFQELYRTIAAGTVWQGEICNRAKDGRLYWVKTTIVPFIDTDGKPFQYISIRSDITARKLAEADALIARDHLKATIDAIPDLKFELGLDGIYYEVHARHKEELATPAEELIGKKVSDVLPPEAAEVVMSALRDANDSGYSHGMQFMLPLAKGNLWFELSVARKPHNYEKQPRFIVLSRDITEQKKAKLELQRSQDMLNEAEHMGQLGSWELDMVSGKLRWSDEVFRIFELDPAEFEPSYDNFLRVIHPDDQDLVNQAYMQSLENKQPYDIEHRLWLTGGRIKWVREHCFSQFDASGKPLRSVGAVQDISKQKLIEENLRVAAVAFETHEAIMITDTNANIVRVNRAFEALTGYSAQEVLGRNPRLLSSGRQSKEFYIGMWQQLLKEKTWSGELWDRSKDGREYPKWLTISAIEMKSGQITGFVGTFNDITARKQAEDEIHKLAYYDALTKLPNRRLLLDHFQSALALSERSNHYGAVLFLDLDRFKTINDTVGHDLGDLLLIDVAKRTLTCVREVDTVSHLGGDEFVILLGEFSADMQEALQKSALIAEKIRSALAQPYQLKGNEYHSSVSIGVCLYRGYEETADVLLQHADLAMYQAKEAGRNAVRFYDPMMQELVETHAELESDLRRAVCGEQLLLHYQIQVDNENRPLGAEALVRWMHPTRGMVLPGEFIPVAEESSLILEVGDWVMDTACKQLAVWGKNVATQGLAIAVNVSGQQFRMHDFVARVSAVIRVHQIAPSRLKLELTESVVLSDVADVVTKMHALKAMGVQLSLDDFGTGYSSLSYLKRLPLDQLKIDQSFVRDSTTDPNDAVMVQTIIGLGRNFRLNVIAEGVETDAQLSFLRQHGCMAYQGYLFSKPVPIKDFEALLNGWQEASRAP